MLTRELVARLPEKLLSLTLWQKSRPSSYTR